MSELEQIKQRLDHLEEQNEQLQNRVDDLEEENEQLRDRVDDLQREHWHGYGQLRTDVDQLEDRLNGATEGAFNKISSLKDRLADLDTPTPEAGETTVQQHETPIEQVVAMPEDMADSQLTANQQRARFIAKDIKTYATRASGTDATDDLLLSPSDLRTVLKSAFDITHSETVDRVRNILADLGGDDIRLREKSNAESWVMDEKARNRMRHKQGKLLVVKPALANRLSSIDDHDVVTGATA